jgi:hypothetical protein
MVVCGRVPDWDFSVSSHGVRVLEELFYDPKIIPKTTKVKMHLNLVQEPRSGSRCLRLRLRTASIQHHRPLRMQNISSLPAVQADIELNRHVPPALPTHELVSMLEGRACSGPFALRRSYLPPRVEPMVRVVVPELEGSDLPEPDR